MSLADARTSSSVGRESPRARFEQELSACFEPSSVSASSWSRLVSRAASRRSAQRVVDERERPSLRSVVSQSETLAISTASGFLSTP